MKTDDIEKFGRNSEAQTICKLQPQFSANPTHPISVDLVELGYFYVGNFGVVING